MIPYTKDRELESGGVMQAGAYGISHENVAHIMTILRDTLYSDKVLAVLREYSANAWDAHRSVGKHDVPISVTLPKASDPTLRIRDYGPGLSVQSIFEVFAMYGASTKRNDDDSVGFLGIGSKSGFAYSDTFTITSWHGGMRRVYVSVLDKSNKGLIQLLDEQPCGDETGIEIQIPVKPRDIEEFERKATKLFQHFRPRPEINVELPKLDDKVKTFPEGYVLPSFDLQYDQRGWMAVMGCIAYRINVEQLRRDADTPLPTYLERTSGMLYFDIGEVEVNASREELKYDERTKKAIITKMEALIDAFVKNALDEIAAKNGTPWEQRLQSQIFKRLALTVPEDSDLLVSEFVKLSDVPPSFQFRQPGKRATVSSIGVNERSQIAIHDDPRSVKGFALDRDVVVVHKRGRVTVEKAALDLAEYLATKKMTGIPIVKTSTLPWTPRSRNGRPLGIGSTGTRLKLNDRVFRFKGGDVDHRNPSESWELLPAHAPSPDDVYVILERFRTNDSFYSHVKADALILKEFGVEMPAVLGYRSTMSKPVREKNVVGITYDRWRDNAMTTLVDNISSAMPLVELHLMNEQYHHVMSDESVAKLGAELGDQHPIVTTLKKIVDASREYKNKPRDMRSAVESVTQMAQARRKLDPDTMEPNRTIKRLSGRYPLLLSYGIDEICGYRQDKWVQYVKLVDQMTPTTNATI